MDLNQSAWESDSVKDGLSRRDVLRWGAVAGAGFAAGGVVSACGAGSASPTSGQLTVGLPAGSSTDTIDPHKMITIPDFARCYQLYDAGSAVSNDMRSYEKRLITEFTPNAEADEWTLRLRPGVEFHNGKTVSADDLIYTIRRVLNPKTAAPEAALWGPFIDPKGLTRVDKLTVKLKLLRPYALLEALFADTNGAIVPVDFDPSKPVGTGPWKLKSFKAGSSSTFVANPNYFLGRAKLDTLTMVDLTDSTARVNALQGGTVQAISSVPFQNIPAVKGSANIKVLEAPSSSWYPIRMNCRSKPFSDVRVRQAFRLIANRPRMLDQVYLGHGVIGNDLYAPYDPDSAQFPQRQQDLDQAKSLLRSAGVLGDAFVFTAANLGPGTLEYASAFAQQAQAAGINVKVSQVDPSVFVGPDFLKWPLANAQWPGVDYLVGCGLSDAPKAAYNETGFGDIDDEFAGLYNQAIATLDADKRKTLIQDMQQIQYERGAYVVWSFANTVDAASADLTGWQSSRSGWSFGSWDFRHVHYA